MTVMTRWESGSRQIVARMVAVADVAAVDIEFSALFHCKTFVP